MTSYAFEHETAVSAAATYLNENIERSKLGINHNELLVLAALVEVAALIPGEPCAALSRYEIADRVGTLSWTQVQRALGSLTDKGLIARRQKAKVSGEVAVTVVSEAAFRCFGMAGGARIGAEGLPADFADLIVGESEEVINAIESAYRNAEPLANSICSMFRGGHRRLTQIEFLLTTQIDVVRQAAEEAASEISAEVEAEERGIYQLRLTNGEMLEFDQPTLRAKTQNAETAIRGADIRFARDVLARVEQRSPGLVTSRNAASLAAEILFSRQKGFVWRHDYGDACRVLAAVILKGRWTAPLKMNSSWYSLIQPTVRMAQGAIH